MNISVTVVAWVGVIVSLIAWIVSWFHILVLSDSIPADKVTLLYFTSPILIIFVVSFCHLNGLYCWISFVN